MHHLKRQDSVDLCLDALHAPAITHVLVHVEEDAEAAVEECPIHDVHECEEAIVPSLYVERVL
jgi:hypothetical protein